MHDQVFTEEALKSGLSQLEGLPLVIYSGGKRREIGIIDAARITSDRTGFMVTAAVVDEEVAGILGSAQDKNEAAASPIGMSEAEIDVALAQSEVKDTVGTVRIRAEVS